MNAARALLLAVVCAAALAGEAQARAGRAGVVTAWGMDDIPLVQPGTRFKAVAAGVELMALTTEGRIVAWSSNGGQEPPSLGPVAGIAAGDEHFLALMPDGTVVAWGAGLTNNPSDDADFGQSIVPPGLGNVVAVSAGGFHGPCSQRLDGKSPLRPGGVARAGPCRRGRSPGRLRGLRSRVASERRLRQRPPDC